MECIPEYIPGSIQDQQRIPLIGGIKLTGRAGKYSIAALSMQSEQTKLEDGTTQGSSNYTAVRLKRDVSDNSNIGLMVLNQMTTANNYSRALGVDGIWNVRSTRLCTHMAATAAIIPAAGPANALPARRRIVF